MEVVSAEIVSCNGDDAVRRSILAAVERASPLPRPSDPALFERSIVFIFKPED
jgi:colicin import membrane protein